MLFFASLKSITYENTTNITFSHIKSGRGAAGSASGLGPEGRLFESGRPDTFYW